MTSALFWKPRISQVDPYHLCPFPFFSVREKKKKKKKTGGPNSTLFFPSVYLLGAEEEEAQDGREGGAARGIGFEASD